MTIREELELQEERTLREGAGLSKNAVRDRCEEKSQFMTDYEVDCMRIISSNAYKRLAGKTQVFFSFENDHLRTRLAHTSEVCEIATVIAKALFLNIDLTRAIALGHDLGHPPFGHSGEDILDGLMPNGFIHEENSVRMAELEGLNLTLAVKDGILNHSFKNKAGTLEGNVVRFADKIAYICHDLEDAVRAGMLPKDFDFGQFGLGANTQRMKETLIMGVIMASDFEVDMTAEIKEKMLMVREFLFENVYKKANVVRGSMAREVIMGLWKYYIKVGKSEREACDWISGMTNDFAIRTYNEKVKT